MVAIADKHNAVCPHLPPEIWQRIFFQHTQPDSLWNDGRKVCSSWRSEIPKVLAKKYLENPDMVQIYFHCGGGGFKGMLCYLGFEMVFDRYEGEAKQRCVFAENPATKAATAEYNNGIDPEFNEWEEDQKFEVWRENTSRYLRGDFVARKRTRQRPRASMGSDEDISGPPGGRFDLPPHLIQIKQAANDSELPNLECDFKKREISFEWQGMFDRFFSEKARQSARYSKETAQRVARGESERPKVVRESVAESVRRERIKKWYLENHNHTFDDASFDTRKEHEALFYIQKHQSGDDFVRCAEDGEEMRAALSIYEYRDRKTGLEEDWGAPKLTNSELYHIGWFPDGQPSL